MLEAAEQGLKVSKDEYAGAEPQLRVDLINAQYDLRNADFSVVLVITGDDRIGMNETIQFMHEWMDARYLETHILHLPSREELERPRFWRYWRALPPRGKIGVDVGGWPLNAVADRVRGRIDGDGFARRLAHIGQFEQDLANDGTLVVKFWLHLPKKQLKKRLKKAEKDEESHWQVEETDWEVYDIYDEAMPHVETLLEATHTEACPWHVVDTSDDRTRNLSFARTLLSVLQHRLTSRPPAPAIPTSVGEFPDALGGVDLNQSLDKDDYKQALRKHQARLAKLSREARHQGLSSVLVFEGWDAAGKGGVIRRVMQAMAVRDYRVVPIAAPTEEERARHYLWRFWRQLPPAGQMLIFDRSWYGRVLVERVEGLASEETWRRAYEEINDFEAQLAEHGMVVEKFWLHIDPEEQLRRFKAREQTAYKKYKITEEDYRNREKWDDYVDAVNEMVARTSTARAPWHLVAANDKRFARVQVLKAVCAALKDALK
ncbi:MAG: polyphosphate:AMP phosphotransferase [Gammaproteobacteria bacterium]|jgi:polyphosphate:AMP phosphotransferase